MNIILLNPALKAWSPNIYVPLGIAYIARVLEHTGYSVEILDLNSRKMSDDKLKERLSEADVIGITGMISEYEEVAKLTSISRECNQKAKIILGGPLATSHTNEILSSSQADFAVRGEGEETIVELILAVKNSLDFSGIRGISYKEGEAIIFNPPRESINNLDTILYPARHLLDMNHYTSSHFSNYNIKVDGKVRCTSIITSRGCPYNCTFCFTDMGGHKWRGRSPDNIIGEMVEVNRDYGFNGFHFCDDTFVMDNERVKKFCNKLVDTKLDISWDCNGRVNLMTKGLLEVMRTAGCKAIAYGIESGNQQILNSIKKGVTLEQIREVVKWTKEADISTMGYFMLGILGDTQTTIRETIDFARELDLNHSAFALTSPIIGTTMYSEAVREGLITENKLEDWTFHASVNLTKDCSIKELECFNKEVFKEFIIEKRYGKHYLLNFSLWLDAFKAIVFLYGKRNYKELLRKVFGILYK